MKNVSFILQRKLNRLFGQPNTHTKKLFTVHCNSNLTRPPVLDQSTLPRRGQRQVELLASLPFHEGCSCTGTLGAH